ncbi:MAG: preprotein translocase subunit SecG [Gammaproteobacteria bacterium]|nr:MAG: preprotein translocase subunit SecG [Gammaproteobacteria bacterium]
METVLLSIHVLVTIALIGLVLIQHGKGADVGAAFGSGASQTLFGSGGSGSFLTRVTTGLAIVFFATSLALAVVANQQSKQGMGIGLPSIMGESGGSDELSFDGMPSDRDVPVVQVNDIPSVEVNAMPSVGVEKEMSGMDSDLPVSGSGE